MSESGNKTTATLVHYVKKTFENTEALKKENDELRTRITKMEESIVHLSACLTSMENAENVILTKLGRMEENTSARRTRAQATQKVEMPKNTFASNSFVWAKLKYKQNKKEFLDKYFSSEQQKKIETKVIADFPWIGGNIPESKKTNADNMQFKYTWIFVKQMVEIKNKIDNDYEAEKAQYNQGNQTAAEKEKI